MTNTDPKAAASVAKEAPVPSESELDKSSDADLRAWAKDNGIDGVPSSGMLSASWRDQITDAMAKSLAADPKAEDSAKVTSVAPITPEKVTETSTPEKPKAVVEPKPVEAKAPVFKEEPVVEYRSVWEAPETWVQGQNYTS